MQTSSSKARHLALNSEALMVRDMNPLSVTMVISYGRAVSPIAPAVSVPHFHVAARRVLDRLELAAAGLARRHARSASCCLDPCEPVRPPRAGMFLRLREPAVEVADRRLGAGPVLVFRACRRIDHAGDMAGARRARSSPVRRRITSRGTPISPARCGPRASRDCRSGSLTLLRSSVLAVDHHLALGELVLEIAIAQIERMVRRRHARGVRIPVQQVERAAASCP